MDLVGLVKNILSSINSESDYTKVVEMPEDEVVEIAETYIERMVRLKPVIASDDEIMRRISLSFCSLYDSAYSRENLNVDSDDDMNFDYGSQHNFYSIGKIIDPQTNEEVHIGLRLNYGMFNLENPDMFNLLEPCLEDLADFEDAFNNNEISKPPYFAGLIKWTRPSDRFELYGLLVEDVSKNGDLHLQEANLGINDGCFIRFNKDKSIDRFYLDPNRSGRKANKFNTDKARIDV